MMIRSRPQPRETAHAPVLAGLREGFSYAWRTLPIRALLLVLVVVALVATPYSALMPVMVREVFGGDAELMGFLMSASGGGAICGTLYLASRKNARGLIRLIIIAVLSAGAALALFANAPSAWIAALLLSVTGFGILVTSVSVNTILQTIVDDDKRGRVMSLYTVAFLGIMPFGALAAGAVADIIGPRATLTIGGLCCVAAALVLARKRHAIRAGIRPIYEKLGIVRQ